MKQWSVSSIVLFAFIVLGAAWKSPSNFDKFVQLQGGTWIDAATNGRSSRLIYGTGSRKNTSVVAAAQEILQLNRSLLQIRDPEAWKVGSVETSGLGTHIRFYQTYQGFVVHRAEVSMHFNQHGQLIALASNALPVSGNLDLQTNRKDAEEALRRLFGSSAKVTLQKLVVVPHRPARLAWSAFVEPNEVTQGAWRVLLDAADVRIVLSQAPEFFTFDGTATVWNENPITTPQRVQSKITYLDKTTELAGKLSKPLDANFEHNVDQPIVLSDYTTAKNSKRRFVYREEDSRAVQAMAYHHITLVQDRFKSLGFRGFRGRAPIFVNVTATDGGPGFDNAYYSPSSQFPKTGIYVFGAGHEYGNTGKDADILYHEYSHGVLDKISPGLIGRPLESVYGFSIHEAFSDLSAAAITGNPRIGEFAFRLVDSGEFKGRILQNRRRFPKHVILQEINMSEPHHTALILSGAWWDLQTMIGSGAAHKLFVQGAYLLQPDADFFDFRDAVLAADLNAGGTNQSHILRAFKKHGITGPSPATKGTIQVHGALMRGPDRIVSEFSRNDDIYFALEYNASGIAPGYFFVPDNIEFNQPAGSNAILVPSLPEIFNGEHTGLNSAAMMQVITDSSTLPGSYSISFTARRGCTNVSLGRYNVTFTLQ